VGKEMIMFALTWQMASFLNYSGLEYFFYLGYLLTSTERREEVTTGVDFTNIYTNVAFLRKQDKKLFWGHKLSELAKYSIFSSNKILCLVSE